MAVAGESTKESLEVLVQQTVTLYATDERFEGYRIGKLAVDEQVCDFEEAGALCELLNRVSPLAKDAFTTIDVGNRGRGGCRIGKAGVVSGYAGGCKNLVDA